VIPNNEGVRAGRVRHARERIASLRASHDGRPLVLSSTGAVAWATGGLSTPIDRVAPTDPVWLVSRDEGDVLVTSSVEVARLRAEHDLDELGFDVASAPWYESDAHRRVAAGLVGRPLEECLGEGEGWRDVRDDVVAARLSLGDAERAVLEGLGRVATEAVETAVSSWRPGVSSDRDVAAEVTAVLERHGADAVCLIVGGDDRVRTFRHPMMVGAPVTSLLMVVVVARAFGLHAALTRLATSGDDAALERRLATCAAVDAAVAGATRPGATWGEAYRALGAAYAEAGEPDAWREHFQGGPIGYAQREFELSPGDTSSPWWERPIEANTAVAWNPSLSGGAKIEDTYVVEVEGLRRVTESGRWPRVAGPASGAAVGQIE
jgi:Xaa-Pro dipeptidase